MAFIVRSEIVEDATQVDGRRHIRECHSEADGLCHEFTWVAIKGQSTARIMADRAVWLEDWLVKKELMENAQEVFAADIHATAATIEAEEWLMSYRYCTPLQFAEYLRMLYTSEAGLDACRIAAWFLAQTDERLSVVFHSVDVVSLRARLQATADRFSALLAAEGE